ncbi:MAG: ABC transporter permease [Clostridiales bacterium]|nr:ABC transporter permease [Clostridiales bacterium]
MQPNSFFRRPSALIGATLLLAILALAILGAFFSPYSPYEQKLDDKLFPPGGEHILGTDEFGRDVFTRIAVGARYSLSAGFASVFVGLLGGLLIGIPSGYFSGAIDKALMFICDVMLAFPGILMAMAISMVIGPGIYTPMYAVGISSVPVFARLIRARFLAIKELPFIEAMKGAGASPLRIAFVHILPNAFGPILVQATLRMGTAMITSSTLSFLGLGAQPPEPEWGTMLNAARSNFWQAPHLAIFPGLAITITVIAVNLLGDALRDHFDPLNG